MTVFKAYTKIMQRGGIAILTYLVIFSVIAISIALSQKKGGEISLDNNLKIGVINLDDGKESLGLVDYLKESFKVIEMKEDEDFIKESLFSQYVEYALKIEKGGKLTSYAYSNPMVSVLANEKIRKYLSLNNLLSSYRIDGEPTKVAGEIMKKDLKFSFNTGEEGRNMSYHFHGYFTSLSYILFSMLIPGIYIGKASFYKRDVKNRIGISREDMKKFNLKIIFSSGTFVIGTWFYFILLSIALFGVENLREGMVYLYILGSFLFLIPVVAFSYLIALVSKTAEINSALMNVITLPFSFISGVFVPRDLLPAFTEKVAIFSPMYWTTRVYENITSGTFFSAETGYFILVEVFMGIMVLSVALVLNKNRALKEV